jgi:hypothetical protein
MNNGPGEAGEQKSMRKKEQSYFKEIFSKEGIIKQNTCVSRKQGKENRAFDYHI